MWRWSQGPGGSAPQVGGAWPGGPESESPLQVLREVDLAGGPVCVLHLNCCPPPSPLGAPTPLVYSSSGIGPCASAVSRVVGAVGGGSSDLFGLC